jgi:hypothetical protein
MSTRSGAKFDGGASAGASKLPASLATQPMIVSFGFLMRPKDLFGCA